MLTRQRSDQPSRNRRRERKSWHHGIRNTPSLGCAICPERALCGGLQVVAPLFSCLDYCCRKPEDCADKFVCPNNAHFVDRVREVGGFDLGTVVRAPSLPLADHASVIPMFFHGKGREAAVSPTMAALPLSGMFNRREGQARFSSREALCAAYRLDPKTSLCCRGQTAIRPLNAGGASARKNAGSSSGHFVT